MASLYQNHQNKVLFGKSIYQTEKIFVKTLKPQIKLNVYACLPMHLSVFLTTKHC